MKGKTRNYIITVGSLVALMLGFFIGLILKNNGLNGSSGIILIAELIGKIWVNILILLVIPLASFYLIYVVLSMMNTRVLGKLGGYSILVHTGILIFGVIFSVSFGFIILEIIGYKLPVLSVTEKNVNEISQLKTAAGLSVEYFITVSGEIQKVLGRLIFLLIFSSIIFAAVISKYFKLFGEKLVKIADRISEKSMNGLQLFLLSLPIAVFFLILPLATKTGFTAFGVAAIFVIILSVLLIVFLLLQYVIVHFWGLHSVSQFAKAMFSSQIVAVSTRSSLATIPSLLETAETKLKIPKTVSAIIIPFFISVFRTNRVISSPFNYIFLTYVYQLDFDIYTFLFFIFIQIIVSFGSPGIPSGGKYLNLPLYLAAGIPLEGYILLKAVDAIPDIFKTLLNVTEVAVVTSVVAKKADWNKI